MYNTQTRTSTYTVVDIRKTFEGCEADIRMIARRTGKWTQKYVDDIFHDIIKLAEEKYLSSVDIVLKDANEKVIKATKFTVNSNGTATSGDRAGANRWENIPNTNLTVILSYTNKWYNLPKKDKDEFESQFKVSWSPTKIDNSFPHLNKSQRQLYASKGYELQKSVYE